MFLVLSCVFTYPLVRGISSSIYGYIPFLGDILGTIWRIWWYRFSSLQHIPANFVSFINYPFGFNLGVLPHNPLFEYLLKFFVPFFNEITTYNLVTIFNFFGAALSMYILSNYLLQNRVAAFLSAFIFAFSPDHCMHSAQHLGYSVILWIPIYILSLLKTSLWKLNLFNILFLSLSFSLMFFTNYYHGYFLLIFTVIYIVVRIVYLYLQKEMNRIVKEAGLIIISLCISFVIFSFFVLNIMWRNSEVAVWTEGSFIRPFKDLYKYAASCKDYFIPSEFHFIFGEFIKKIVSRHFFERTLYLGYVPLVLAVTAVINHWRYEKKTFGIIVFTVSGILFFVFSLSPIFSLGSLRIPNFSFFAYKILPMFRVYARMGLLVILSIGILAGYGLKIILEKTGSKWKKRSLAGLCLSMVMFEYINFIPFHNVNLTKIPGHYTWLAGIPEALVLAEYPFVRNIEEKHSEYLFYQKVHRKKLINGAEEGTLGDAFRKQLQYPQLLETAEMLAYLGATHVIINKNYYPDAELDAIGRNPGFKFIIDFPEAEIYKTIARPKNLNIVYWNNFANWEKWDDGNYWRWLGNNATIWLGSSKRQIVDIRFKILSFAEERNLGIYINDLLIMKLDIVSPSNPNLAQEVALKKVLLHPGENILRFYTPDGEGIIGDILHNNDDRRVSFAISDFRLQLSNTGN